MGREDGCLFVVIVAGDVVVVVVVVSICCQQLNIWRFRAYLGATIDCLYFNFCCISH
jgi:hypothetical protein